MDGKGPNGKGRDGGQREQERSKMAAQEEYLGLRTSEAYQGLGGKQEHDGIIK